MNRNRTLRPKVTYQRNRVAVAFACPNCGERRVDWLEWVGLDADSVECQTCRAVYNPNSTVG